MGQSITLECIVGPPRRIVSERLKRAVRDNVPGVNIALRRVCGNVIEAWASVNVLMARDWCVVDQVTVQGFSSNPELERLLLTAATLAAHALGAASRAIAFCGRDATDPLPWMDEYAPAEIDVRHPDSRIVRKLAHDNWRRNGTQLLTVSTAKFDRFIGAVRELGCIKSLSLQRPGPWPVNFAIERVGRALSDVEVKSVVIGLGKLARFGISRSTGEQLAPHLDYDLDGVCAHLIIIIGRTAIIVGGARSYHIQSAREDWHVLADPFIPPWLRNNRLHQMLIDARIMYLLNLRTNPRNIVWAAGRYAGKAKRIGLIESLADDIALAPPGGSVSRPSLAG